MIVDLEGSRCVDADLKRILPRLKFFPRIAELRLTNTKVTDAGLDVIGKTFQDCRSLRRLDVSSSGVSAGGIQKLRRLLSELEVVAE